MRDAPEMRTTLDIDDDILEAAKEIASSRGSTAGRVLSDLARAALEPATPALVRNSVLTASSRSSAPVDKGFQIRQDRGRGALL